MSDSQILWSQAYPPPAYLSYTDGLVLAYAGGGQSSVVTQSHKSVAGLTPYIPPGQSWYIEFRSKSDNNIDNLPAVWLMPQEHDNKQTDQMPGQPPKWEEWMEFDIDEGWSGKVLCSMHHWQGIYPNYTRVTLSNSGKGPVIDRTLYHTAGFGYDMANSKARWYMDGVNIFTADTTAVDAIIQRQHFYAIGSVASHGANVPFKMTLQSISAWSGKA